MLQHGHAVQLWTISVLTGLDLHLPRTWRFQATSYLNPIDWLNGGGKAGLSSEGGADTQFTAGPDCYVLPANLKFCRTAIP